MNVYCRVLGRSNYSSFILIPFLPLSGYGIRICKPAGPRQEPNGWKVRTLTNSVA